VAGTTAAADVAQEVQAIWWYHTLELGPGLETPGYYDLRGILGDMPLPGSLEGLRCLDIGTFDGFWAFEMERRGAADVIAIDILDPRRWDWPGDAGPEALRVLGEQKGRGAGFEIARRELGSSVNRLELSVYDLDPEEVGTFDLVYLGSLLLHLRDPVGALERVRSVCRGTLVVCDAVDPTLSRLLRGLPAATLDGRGRPWWWKPNVAGLQRMVEAAGFKLTQPAQRIRLPPGRGYPRPPIRPVVLLHRLGREEVLRRWRGDHHAVLVARPR
jgi:tRNA (mo5U34)-methyltransferase